MKYVVFVFKFSRYVDSNDTIQDLPWQVPLSCGGEQFRFRRLTTLILFLILRLISPRVEEEEDDDDDDDDCRRRGDGGRCENVFLIVSKR